MSKDWISPPLLKDGKLIYGGAARNARIKEAGGMEHILEAPKNKKTINDVIVDTIKRDYLIAKSGIADGLGGDYSFHTYWDSAMTEAEFNQPLDKRLEKIRVLSRYVR
jgi:hypothetical protein